MNGLSDVRLVLRSQELVIEQERAITLSSARRCAPGNISTRPSFSAKSTC